MKITIPLYILLALGSISTANFCAANPMPEASIPETVDWFAHLDADQLRSTRVGGSLFEQLANIDLMKENEKLPINPILVLNGLKGITAFGTIPNPQADGEEVDVVALISGTPELMQIFKGLLAGFQLEKPEAIAEIEIEGNKFLFMKEAGISGIFLGEDQIAISKSMVSMTKFLSVHSGKADHMQFGKQFPVPNYVGGMGVYMGVYVEGLSDFQNLPAQARILQLTEAVAVQLGETQDNLHLLASLITDVPKTASQVSDVLNGLVAVMMLTQNGHPDVATLVNSAKVSQQDNAVTLKVDYPAASAEKWIGVLVEMMKAKMSEDAQAAEPVAGAESDEEIESIEVLEPVG